MGKREKSRFGIFITSCEEISVDQATRGLGGVSLRGQDTDVTSRSEP